MLFIIKSNYIKIMIENLDRFPRRQEKGPASSIQLSHAIGTKNSSFFVEKFKTLLCSYLKIANFNNVVFMR